MTDEIERFASGGPWEERFGYSRAVRAGDLLFVAGTTAVDEDGVVRGIGDAGAQTAFVLDRIEAALARAGASLEQVVQTRMYITDVGRAEEIGRVHGERFASHPPASAIVQVAALLDPRMLVEIEAVAYVGPSRR
ncbi:MAG TPA: RidA family protein [Solirubrobacteraceae bacterium]|nr:RidA family protein [Solirubrobacteraceae bacterium]